MADWIFEKSITVLFVLSAISSLVLFGLGISLTMTYLLLGDAMGLDFTFGLKLLGASSLIVLSSNLIGAKLEVIRE